VIRPSRGVRDGNAIVALIVGVALVLVAPASARAAGTPSYVQGSAFTTSSRVTSQSVTLTGAVSTGDLLIGWFAQYNTSGQVRVSDSVNGAWTRAAAATTFGNGTGDIALYYLANAKPAAAGALKITVTASSSAYFQGAVAEYSAVATSAPLDQAAVGRGVGTAVSTVATPAVSAGELVFAAAVTGGNPGGVTPGSTAGKSYTARAATGTGSAFDEDVLASAAGAQSGSATLRASTDWYAVVAVVRPGSATPPDTQPPTVPGTPQATSVTASSVALSWTASSDNVGVAGYTVYRNNAVLATTQTAAYTDSTVQAGTTYSYAVDAYDAAGNHSARTTGVSVTTPAPSATSPQFVQGNAISSAGRVASTTLTLSGAVSQGDLLVGWFAQYNAAGQVSVFDSVNGAWTRASAATAFQNDTGDIALYYVANARAAAAGTVTITVSASAPAYLEAVVDDYSGVAVGGPLDQAVVNRGVGTAVSAGPTSAVPAGELVFSGLITGGAPGSVTAGSSQGAAFTPRAATTGGAVYSEDILAAVAGAQTGTATLASSTDWYAVVATFRTRSVADSQAPTTPTGLHTTGVSAGTVSLAWTASSDNIGVTGYTVYRNGSALTMTTTPSVTDSTVNPATTYSYTVDAFDAAGNHSPQSAAVQVLTPASSPAFVQGAADSPGSRMTSTTMTLARPVASGDLLVGWVAQFDSTGQVQVSDPVNGSWTRSTAAETFTSGAGDIALFYVANTKASATGLTITISATSATYLPSAVGEYSGIAPVAALDQAVVGKGVGVSANAGPTVAVPAGELVVGGLLTGGQPLSVTPGSSQGVPFQVNVFNGSRSADLAAIYSGATGSQSAPFTLGQSMDWYAVVATFRPE
jgi:chitodextrinase